MNNETTRRENNYENYNKNKKKTAKKSCIELDF